MNERTNWAGVLRGRAGGAKRELLRAGNKSHCLVALRRLDRLGRALIGRADLACRPGAAAFELIVSQALARK
jgi:hypothetical protein